MSFAPHHTDSKPYIEHMESATEKQGATVLREHDESSSLGMSLDADAEAALRKSLLWKLDTRILPVLALLFLFSFLGEWHWRAALADARAPVIRAD